MLSTRLTGLAVVLGLATVLATGCATSAPAAAPPSTPPATTTVSSALPALPTVSSDASLPPGVPRIPPEQQDPAFQHALDQRNLVIADSPAETSQYGHIVCAHLNANEPLPALVNDVQSSAHLDLDNTGYVLGSATAVYCPQNLSKLPSQ